MIDIKDCCAETFVAAFTKTARKLDRMRKDARCDCCGNNRSLMTIWAPEHHKQDFDRLKVFAGKTRNVYYLLPILNEQWIYEDGFLMFERKNKVWSLYSMVGKKNLLEQLNLDPTIEEEND